MIQGALAALITGFLLRHVGPGDATHVWPYVVMAWGVFASMTGWIAGGYTDEELHPGYSVLVGILVAAPWSLCAYWIAGSPYRGLYVLCRVMLGLAILHFVVASIVTLRRPRSSANPG